MRFLDREMRKEIFETQQGLIMQYLMYVHTLQRRGIPFEIGERIFTVTSQVPRPIMRKIIEMFEEMIKQKEAANKMAFESFKT
jgi:hypothetical protein